VDAGKFTGMRLDPAVYRGRQSMLEGLEGLVPRGSAVAMEYSPGGALPRVSRVDAGTIDLVRGLGVDVVSSGDLLQYATQRWSQAQLASHVRAAEGLSRIVLEAFDYIGERLADRPTELQVAQFIRERFRQEGLHSPDGPIVAVNAHASDPHYEPQLEGSSPIGAGDWVLIDLWAKEQAQDSVYADITWVGFVGDRVPERQQQVFQVVMAARDAALKYLEGSARRGLTLQGCQVDRIAREYIARQGYGDYFTHRLGHSIGREVHGDAVNLDGFETEDTRSILTGICFSIEPGIYLPEFGVRSEIDVYMSDEGPYPTTAVQRDVVLIGS
jgi:Xaa-Pro aminopeptidase